MCRFNIPDVVNTAARIRRVRRAAEDRSLKLRGNELLGAGLAHREWEARTWAQHVRGLTYADAIALTEMLQAWALHEEGEGGGEPAYDAAGHFSDAVDCLSSAAERMQEAA